MKEVDTKEKGCPHERNHGKTGGNHGCKEKPTDLWDYARYDKMWTEKELELK